jgi:hypothetical protein
MDAYKYLLFFGTFYKTMNTIVQHIADFLKEYAPFDQLTRLSDIAGIRVVN